MPQSDATGPSGHQAAAIDAGAGPGATAILQGMLETLSEVLGGLDQRLGRLEARLDDVAAGRDATAEAVARLGTGMSQLVSRLDRLAQEDDDPASPPPEVDVEAVAEAVAGRLDGVLSALSRLDRLEALDGLDQRLARLDQADAALLDAVAERLAPLDGLPEGVAARVATTVDGLGEGLRVVLARLGDLSESVDSGLGSLSEALAADDEDDDQAVDVAAVVAEESERVRAIVAGLGQAVTAAHADIAGAVAEEAHRTRAALDEALAGRPDEAERIRAAVAEAVPDAATLAAAVAEEGERIRTAVAEEVERLRAAVAASGPDLLAAVADEGDRIRAAVAEGAPPHPDLLAAVAQEATRIESAAARAGAESAGDAVVARIEALVADAVAVVEQRHQAVSEALDRLASAPTGAGVEVVERSLAAAQADLRRALDEAVLLVTDRQDAQAAAVRQAVDGLRAELATLAESDGDDGPDVAALVSEASQASERSVARMHADLRGAVDELARALADRPSVPDDLRATLADLGERQESYGAQVQQALGGLTQAVGALRGDVAALAERPDDGAEVADLLDRHAADVRQAVDALAAAIPAPPDVRGALDDALLVLADRQERGTDELRQAIGRLRSELAALAEADDGADGPDVAALLARQAEEARGDLARLETVLRGQVAEVSGRAGSITDVIGRLDGRLHEVVDGVRSLSRHLEATATLVPAVEALRAEVDELRRLYEQPRLRAVNGGE